MINTPPAIGGDRESLLIGQANYQTSLGLLPGRYIVLKEARDAAYLYCGQARNVLEFFLGKKHNSAWRPTGFISSLEVPTSESGLVTLLTALASYFTANPARQNEELNVTTERTEAVLETLGEARQAVDAQMANCVEERMLRDAAAQTMRKRIRGLCQELSQRISPLDPRWRDFGLNMPGAPSVPAVPQDVMVTPLGGARLQVLCSESARATNYRFYYQRPILDPEPILAGGWSEPLFIIDGLQPGQNYLIYVSSVNSGAESELSDPVSATVQLAAAA